MSATAPVWDRHSILAEVRRRGGTLTGIAIEAGLYNSACRQALNGQSLAGAQALSRFLGVPVETLFPDRYRSARPAHQNRNAGGARGASQKRTRSADAARAS